ncbi:MAG: tetratricopeptide repeat protein, partial [Bacteroidetes bacterium]|nr:tetratricopeptide repeat protein [Bacteroidota bacterium]
AKATVFFKDIISTHPNNKTARLCLGRAVGLSGRPKKAKELFIDLLSDFPSDFEIELNYAEALLWNKEYTEAKKHYKDLIKHKPQDFSALLGYANTLSNLKEYDQALSWIEKALSIFPENKNALVSQKYMRLGKAAQLIEQENPSAALLLLNENFENFPNDLDTRRAIINIQLIHNDLEGAEKNTLSLKDSIEIFTGLSLIFHKRKKDKKALDYAKIAFQYLAEFPSLDDEIHVSERYVQALLWNGKIAQVKKELKKLEKRFPKDPFVLRLKASLGMYTGQFKKSITLYENILSKDSTSFDGNLGIANAYKGRGNLKLALLFANKTLEFYPNQIDAKKLIKEIETSMSPTVGTRTMYTVDNGKNEAQGIHTTGRIPFSNRLVSTLEYEYRSTENKISKEMAYNNNIRFGLDYRLLNNTWICNKVGFIKATGPSNNFQEINGSIFIKSRPLPLQYLEVGYSRNLQNFNAALIDEQIFMNNFSLNYNMGTNIGLGWYTGFMHTAQTDQNSRDLLFTSLYYNFGKRPNLKGGVNYQYLSFKNQRPSLYFSPDKYQALELFAEISGNKGNFSYHINTAVGMQYLQEDSSTSLFRIEGSLNYTPSERLRTTAYSKYSNIASATATGFEFLEVGVQFQWSLTKRNVKKSL